MTLTSGNIQVQVGRNATFGEMWDNILHEEFRDWRLCLVWELSLHLKAEDDS